MARVFRHLTVEVADTRSHQHVRTAARFAVITDLVRKTAKKVTLHTTEASEYETEDWSEKVAGPSGPKKGIARVAIYDPNLPPCHEG